MAYEIDYLPVGEGQRSGDAISVRYGNLHGTRAEQTVIVIDGGDKASGEAMVEHIVNHYGTDYVDYVVSTHPDSDHTSGLAVVMEKLKVGTLLMHRPWEHVADIKESFKDERWTDRGISEKVEKALKHACDLEAIAERKGTKIVEPFQGVKDGSETIHILGPSEAYYEELLTHFRSTPDAKDGLLQTIVTKTEDVIRYVEDALGIDLLNDDEDTTSAENNSSVILLLRIDGHRLLFTGDAGKTSLLNAIAYAESQNISLVDVEFLGVPHHGSRRNMSSKILKKIVPKTAYVSATGENPKHPSKKVTNALKKVNAKVVVIRKTHTLYHHQGNLRGWTGFAIEEQFYCQVEE